jgi:hypothetical protein
MTKQAALRQPEGDGDDQAVDESSQAVLVGHAWRVAQSRVDGEGGRQEEAHPSHPDQAWPPDRADTGGQGGAEPGGEGQQGQGGHQDGDGVDPAEGAKAELADGMAPGAVAGAGGALDQESGHEGGEAGRSTTQEQPLMCTAVSRGSGLVSCTEHLMLQSFVIASGSCC